MKILYIHQYFTTPEKGGAIRSYHLSSFLAEEKYDVEIITAHNENHYKEEKINDITIHYLPVFYNNSLGFIGRIWSFLKFFYKAYRLGSKIKDVTVCFASSTPLTVGLIAYLLWKRKKIPYYFEVRDLWPEAPIQMGFINNKVLKYMLFRLEKLIYANAKTIVALSPGIKEGIQQKAPDKPIVLIPNFSDIEYFSAQTFQQTLNKPEGKFTIAYTGAMGKANELSKLSRLIKHCQEHFAEDIFFFIAGAGSECMAFLEEIKDCHNYEYFGFTNKQNIRQILSASDAVYISFADIPVLETCSPNKFFDGLAAGKICITNTRGWIKDLIEQNDIGFYNDVSNLKDFDLKISPYLKDKNLIEATKKRARILAESQFSKNIMREKFLSLFNNQ